MMKIISKDEIIKIFLYLSFLIFPTILLSVFLPSALQNYSLTGNDLWELKIKHLPEELIQSLHDIKNKEYFFKYKLMNEVESKISSHKQYKKNEKLIENQISKIKKPLMEFYFLGFLAFYYYIILMFSRKFFLIKKTLNDIYLMIFGKN